MATTPITSTPPQTPQGTTTASVGGSSTPQASPATPGSGTSSAAATSKPGDTSKPDNDAVKVSLSDTATKLLAANKKVNPDGTVGPHHKPRHLQPVTKPA
jgi:hypothetical protein